MLLVLQGCMSTEPLDANGPGVKKKKPALYSSLLQITNHQAMYVFAVQQTRFSCPFSNVVSGTCILEQLDHSKHRFPRQNCSVRSNIAQT